MESKSTFVTVLAWIFIVGAGFASFVSLTQVIMVSMMFSGDEFKNMPEDAPEMARFMSEYFHLFIYGFFTLAVFTLASSIALLKRQNWARIAFIGILSVGVLWQLGGLVMQFFMFSDFPELPRGERFEEFEQISHLIRWVGFAIAILSSGLFIWMIKKLVTPPIIAEFAANESRKAGA